MNINNSKRALKLNEYKGGKRPQVLAIVLHDTAGAGSINDVNYLANDPDHRGVSVDFVVLRDGEIYKLNPDLTRYSTNHAGRRTYLRDLDHKPILNTIGGEKGPVTNGNCNAHTIGIEISHEVYAGTSKAKQHPEWPEEQVRAVGELCRDLCEKFNLSREAITTHQAIVTDRSRTDPRNFPWAVFWAGFNRVTVDSIHVVTGSLIHTVVDGDTLWGLANRYHTSIEAIKSLNDMDTPSTVITVGQKLTIKE